jgi:AraC-like DNA-binding protein
MKIIKQAEFDEIYEESQQAGEILHSGTEFELKTSLPSRLGHGSEQYVQLRHGLSIHIIQGQLSHALRLEKQHSEQFPLVSKFYLAGSSRVFSPGIQDVEDDYEEHCSHHYLYCLPEIREFEQYEAGQPISIVYICLDLDVVRSFSQDWGEFPTAFQRLIHGAPGQRFHQALGKMGPTILPIVQQILNCPYHGLVKQVYLESKALELFAMQLAQYTNVLDQSKEVVLRSADIDRLHQAKELLQGNSDNPPSVSDLAQQVGLNRRKLNEGFRQLFGTTPYGCLRNYRLEKAQELLANSERSVEEVAKLVGYGDRSHFATAFRKKFGMNPKMYQLQRQQ